MAEENEIIKSFGETILECNSDVLSDVSEIAIDFAFEESPLVELPIIKIINGIAKTGIAIRERNLMLKTLSFINKLNQNNIDSKEYEEYKKRIEENDKEVYKELEHVLIIIDKVVEKEKAEILANLYTAYVNKQITWERFKNLSLILDNFLIYDKVILRLLYSSPRQYQNMQQDSHGSVSRLISLGLAYNISGYSRNPISGNISFSPPRNDVDITEFGKDLYRYGFCEK